MIEAIEAILETLLLLNDSMISSSCLRTSVRSFSVEGKVELELVGSWVAESVPFRSDTVIELA